MIGKFTHSQKVHENMYFPTALPILDDGILFHFCQCNGKYKTACH